MRRLLVVLGLLAGVLVLADRGLAVVAGNSTAHQIRLHEGFREDPTVEYRGFPFVTQAVRGRFKAVDVSVRDVERDGLIIDRIDAHLVDVKVKLNKALRGKVIAVPIREGSATMRITYADLAAYLSTKAGNIRVGTRDGRVVVTSRFGIPGVGEVEVEGTPRVEVTKTTVRVVVSDSHTASGDDRLTAELAARASARASFTILLSSLPFGIQVASAELTDTALVVRASATGLVVQVRS